MRPENDNFAEASVLPLWSRVLRHSMFHFFLLGSLLFGLDSRTRSSKTIILRRSALDALYQVEANSLRMSSLSSTRKQEVRSRYVQDQLLACESRRLGLAESDTIIEQRLIQKLLFFSLRLRGADVPPTESQLRRYFQSHRSRWKHAPATSFVHIFVKKFNAIRLRQLLRLAKKRGSPFSQATDAMGRVISVKENGGGDSFPIGNKFRLEAHGRLKSLFGVAFLRRLVRSPLRRWSGPFLSKYGWHLVYHKRTVTKALMSFREARSQVRFDFILERKQRVYRQVVAGLRKRYKIKWIP